MTLLGIEKYIGFNREEFESSPLFGESLTTTVVSSTKIGCLISGCLGRVIIWQNDGSVGWISAPIDENMAVTHLALLEPTDDPRPFYYLWAVFQDESSSKAPSVLRMYAMLFERKYCDRGINLYFNLEADPSLKFEFELSENDKVVDLCTVEREINPEQTDSGVKRGEDNLLLISTSERTLLFDLNQWYKEQMPRTIDECQNPNSILAIYRARSNLQKHSCVMSFAYVPLSLREFPSNGPSSPEELFYPNSLSLEWVELSPTRLTFWMTRGIQADLLREMATAGPVILLQPSETFHRCLSAGLVPFNSEFSFASDCNAQREMLLSLCLEQRWPTFLVKCALDWADGSAAYLYPSFLKWGIQRASAIKMLADRLCIPLFDQSGSGIGEADVRTLRFCSQQLECLSNVVAKLPFGTADLANQRRTLKRVSTYFQVLLWFYDVGLLPETQELEEEGTFPISLALKVPYPYEKLSTSYKEKRAQVARAAGGSAHSQNEEEEVLFIDELITRECSVLRGQWEREGGVGALGGSYPPPSLQSLLRSYLTDCHHAEPHEVNCKHQITIYLLMDLAMLLQRLYPGVDQLIKYPSAFKMSPSLIKLTQAFWLLDHEDYQGFLDMMTGQLVSDSDVKDWHHRFILRTLVRNNQHKLALVYLRVRKPPLSSMEEQSVAVSLSVEHGLVQSAFHRRPPCHYEQLLTCFFRACKTYGKLDEILHLALDSEEEEVFVKFLEENKTEDVRLLYYLQRCRYTEAIGSSGGHHPTIVHHQPSFAEDAQPTLSMLGAYNTTLPDITKRFSANAAAAINLDADPEAPRNPRPMSHCKSHDRLRGIHETVIAKARETYRGEKCQIPFVSAPCMALKLNNHGANVNCVLFPARNSHRSGKRTADQIYEDDEEAIGDTVDNAKRRKLSDGSVSSNKSGREAKESELSLATPLVKRKFNASANKNVVSETPQSILKMRHLIRSSVSPSVAISLQEKEITDKLADSQSKKVSRQIRFNINQPKKILTYEDDEEKEEHAEKERVEEEEDANENDVGNKNSMLSGANDVFHIPSTNDKSCSESAVLSDNSSNSSRSYCFPRPRPSLRRSALQSSIEMLQESLPRDARKPAGGALSMNTSSLAANEADKPPAFTANTPRKRSSILSAASGYSTTMLSSDSNVEVSDYSLKRLEHSIPQSRWSLSAGKDRRSKFTSSTPLTKRIVSQKRVCDERAVEECEKEKEENEEEVKDDDKVDSYVKNARNELDVPSEPERLSNIEQPAYGESGLAEQRDNLEKKNTQGEQSESKYNNGNLARTESPSADGEQPVLSNPEKVARSSLTASDESDEELLQLRYNDDDDDEEDDDEVFKSLSISLEDTQMRLQSEVPVSSCPPDTWNPEEHDLDKKSNGLRESVQVAGNIDFTDDESTMSKDATVPHESDDVNERKTCSTATARSENVLYDMPNITDDESDSNIKEAEEPKDDRLSDLPGRYSAKQGVVEAGKSCESDEKSGTSNRKDSVSRRDASETSTLLDAESREKLPETTGSSKRKRSQVDPPDGQTARVTRSHRASSLAKDTVAANTSSSQTPAETERVTRSRRGSSLANDSICTTDHPSSRAANAERPPQRSRRASSMAKDSFTDSPARSADEPARLRRVNSTALDSLADSSSRETEPGKPTRLRKASSAKDISLLVKPRSRRASSLAKEVAVRSIDEDLGPSSESTGPTGSPAPVTKRGRSRSTSVAKEVPPSELKDSDCESVKNEPSVRRSTRLTSSTKKESQADDGLRARAKSEGLSAKSLSDDEEDKSTKKRSTRARKSSTKTTSKSPTTNLEEQPEVVKASRTRRGSSVPKEITVQTGRRRRSGSIIKEIIPEDSELSIKPEESPRRLRSSRNAKEIVDSPATRTRRRSASIQSIPEELEDVLSESSSRGTRAAARKETAHARRATSADVLHKDVKVRLLKMKSIEPIAEESVAENEGRIELRDEAQDSEVAERNVAPVRRKRAASVTTFEDAKKEATARRNQDRTRRMSANKEKNDDLFSFSQPENVDDVPSDEKGV